MEEVEWNGPGGDKERDGDGDEESGALLPEHEHGFESEEEYGEGDLKISRRSIKPTIWMVLSVIATLAVRKILRGGFSYPFYLVFLIQLAAYLIVAIVVLLVRLMNFRRAKRKPEERYRLWEYFFMGTRTLISSVFAGVAMLCGAKALMMFSNLPVVAMLPIVTYVCDSIFFRLAYVSRLLPRDQKTAWWRFPKDILVILGVALVVYEDYHLDIEALLFALAGFSLSSLAKVFSRIGPKIESKGTQTWESPLHVYLLAGIIPLVLSGYATSKLENMVVAGHIAQSWTITYRLASIGPAVALHAMFSSSLNSAFPFISEEHIGGALEEPSDPAREACATTLQAGFWIFVVGVLGQERNFIDWMQVIAFTLIYIVCVGPKHIGYYPPRVLNIIIRIFRRRPLPIHAEPWQFSFFLATTTIVFAILISTNTMYWVDTIAYHHELLTWHGPKPLSLDTDYRPPQVRSFDMVIAHSAGDPLSSITTLIDTITTSPQMFTVQPRITVYTKDPTFNTTTTTPDSLRGQFEGILNIQVLPNAGGPTATHLHHILYSWAFLPVQTLFLSTSSITSDPTTLPLLINHLTTYFLPLGFPLPDALPKTGFLNLGPSEVCNCNNCHDSHGWEDSFHLLPSMFGAAYPMSPKCDNVLVTYGNDFVASAARLRGIKRDVWQLLYDALVNVDLRNAWAHSKEKLPVKLDGEGEMGRWGKGGVFGEKDSLERPYLGLAVERMWGVLLQCSEGELAWGCPGFGKSLRLGGAEGDCGCIE